VYIDSDPLLLGILGVDRLPVVSTFCGMFNRWDKTRIKFIADQCRFKRARLEES